MKLSKNAKIILKGSFLKKDKEGNVIESPEDMFERVAENIASAEKIYNPKANLKKIKENFYKIMANLEFLPNAPTLRNAGREFQQLAACFVLPVPDSIEGIFEAVKNMALIQKSGGGTGFSFSRLRPEGSRVKETQGVASGPVSFMKVFDTATGAIREGGVRRGANMGILRVDHPDTLKFITCKKKANEFTNFNISVALTQKFMRALQEDKDFKLIDPRTKKVAQKIKARKIFNLICQMAWLNGEPGVIFIDEINRHNPTPKLGKIEATNPCGEVNLLAYESCNLGSINLSKMVKNGEIDWNKLKNLTHLGIHFLDNVIDKTNFPLPKIKEMTRANRKIGLGVMGFADFLIKLGIPYDSNRALNLAKKIMRFINEESKDASRDLAQKRGVFPNFKKSIYAKKGLRLRNATTIAIAPTGTLSLIADTSPSIEPIFAPIYLEIVTLFKKPLLVINSLFKKMAQEQEFYSKKLIQKVLASGSCRGIKEIPKDVQEIFVCAHDVSPEWHVKIQGAFQKYTDNSVSKTVNLPENAKKEDVKKIFMMAYKFNLKGLTIYREKSRKEQILNTCKCKITN